MPREKKVKNIRKREDGKYYYRYRITDPVTGKRVPKETKGFATQKEAEEAGIRIQAELLYGTYNIRKSTINSLKERMGGIAVLEITPAQYQEVLNKLKAEGYSQSSISSFHTVMKMMFKELMKQELIKKDITAYVDIPAFTTTVEEIEAGEEIPEYFEKEELALLLNTAKQIDDAPQLYRLLYILAFAGMRIGELCALTDKDIDEVNKVISVTKTLYVPNKLEDYELNTPKNKSSVRKIDVSDKVINVIREQRTWRNEFKMMYRDHYYNGRNFLFINDQRLLGYPMRISYAEDKMADVLKIAKLPLTLTPHSLRHTYTSLMAEAEVTLPEIQKLLGHKKDRTTEVIYLHITKSRKRAAVEKLDTLMDSVF
ncbi:tyrosine-type recombinase/integrase [Sinorhizobium medicae]|nr:tyrosine-type recombinase/integrase [Sinorhizobium medicae]